MNQRATAQHDRKKTDVTVGFFLGESPGLFVDRMIREIIVLIPVIIVQIVF